MKKQYKKWTEAELAYIKDNLTLYTDSQLSVKLSQISGSNITNSMIRRQRRKLGVAKKRGRPRLNKVVENKDAGIEPST